MAHVVVTMKIMPEEVDSDLNAIEAAATKLITEFGGKVGKSDHEPVAFGLKAIKLMFVMNENIGSTESLEEEIKKMGSVASVDVIDVRRTIG
ncbi:MAG TPA: elongation factor 1-beta [Candidatus Nanoarchaeia archaeon]|nr:elongation factor 1-beta [Candidatus Nanoarchaeia archaeon]